MQSLGGVGYVGAAAPLVEISTKTASTNLCFACAKKNNPNNLRQISRHRWPKKHQSPGMGRGSHIGCKWQNSSKFHDSCERSQQIETKPMDSSILKLRLWDCSFPKHFLKHPQLQQLQPYEKIIENISILLLIQHTITSQQPFTHHPWASAFHAASARLRSLETCRWDAVRRVFPATQSLRNEQIRAFRAKDTTGFFHSVLTKGEMSTSPNLALVWCMALSFWQTKAKKAEQAFYVMEQQNLPWGKVHHP